MLTPVRDLVPDKKKSTNRFAVIAGLVIGFLLAIIIRSIVHGFFFHPYIVENNRMNPGLKKGQRIVIDLGIKEEKIKRGEIVLLQHPAYQKSDKFFIARIVALPGETIEIKDRQVIINGQLLDDDWERDAQKYSRYLDKYPLQQGNQNKDQYPVLKIPKNTIFVLQDNRSDAIDSRNLGLLSPKMIRGHIEIN